MYISGCGCGVEDNIYKNVDFSTSRYARFIRYGESTDVNVFERESGASLESAIGDITDGAEPQRRLGGVCVVALVDAAQLLSKDKVDVFFYKNVSANEAGNFLMEKISHTPLKTDKIVRKSGRPEISYVLCDNQKKDGTRSFICPLHVYDELAMEVAQVDEAFFKSDFTLFNCILWEPKLENRLSYLLEKCKENGSLTLVGTASDPRFCGGKKWVMGDGDKGYPYIDVLMMNLTEARGYAGCASYEEMTRYFKAKGVKSFVITDGMNPTYLYAGEDGPFEPYCGFIPVVSEIDDDKEKGILEKGDGVGCGDNFDGGLLASLALQKKAGVRRYSMLDAVLLGNVSGGLTSCIVGGTFTESYPGEKYDLTMRYYVPYRTRVRKELGLS